MCLFVSVDLVGEQRGAAAHVASRAPLRRLPEALPLRAALGALRAGAAGGRVQQGAGQPGEALGWSQGALKC